MLSQVNAKRLSVHHIGGRSGSRGFPTIKNLEHLITSVMYDADFDCIEQIAERSSKSGGETLVLPFALSAKTGIGKLHLTYDPNMTSLLKPLSDLRLNYQYPKSNFDYDLRRQ